MADETSFPETIEGDSDDVNWALETGRSMWSRGDHVEALKWLKRAADTASEEEDDMRSLTLAKAAAELRTKVENESGPLSATPPPIVDDAPADDGPADGPAKADADADADAKKRRSLPVPTRKASRPAPPAARPSRPTPPAKKTQASVKDAAPASQPAPESKPAPQSAPAPKSSQPPKKSPTPQPRNEVSKAVVEEESPASGDDGRPTMIQPMKAQTAALHSPTGSSGPERSAARCDAIRVAIQPDPATINSWVARPLPDGADTHPGERIALLVALDGESLGIG